jgi:hypothetical protein
MGTTQLHNGVRYQPIYSLAKELNTTRGRAEYTGYRIEQRRFAGSVGTNNKVLATPI